MAPWQSGLRAGASSYGAVIYTFVAVQGFFVAVMIDHGALHAGALAVRPAATESRRATFDNTMLLWHYTTAQGLVAIAISTFFPRLLG